jgi:hypothetical protein
MWNFCARNFGSGSGWQMIDSKWAAAGETINGERVVARLACSTTATRPLRSRGSLVLIAAQRRDARTVELGDYQA